MTTTARTRFLVKDLLDELRTERGEPGTGALLRVQELLRHLPDDLADEELLLALAPVLARSPQEQEQVYEKFRECQRRADEMFGPRMEPVPPPGPLEEKIRRSKIWLWASAAVLAAVLGGLAWMYFRLEQGPVVEKDFAVTAGQTTTICPDAVPELDSFGQKITGLSIEYAAQNAPQTRLERNGGVTGKGEGVNTPQAPATVGGSDFATFSIQNDTCLLYSARDSARGTDSLVLKVAFANGNTCQLRLRIYVAPPVQQVVEDVITDPAQPIFRPRKIPHDHTQALLDLAVQPADAWQQWLAQNWNWLRWAIFLPFTALLFALWRWLEWRRRKLVAELDRPDKPPYVWNIRIEGAADDIITGDAYHHALQVMRRRTATDTLRLDVPRTIRDTVAKGGMPTFRYRPHTQPVDYLLLLDRQTASNHRTQLFDAVYQALKAQELHIERFFYDADLRVGFNEEHPEGLRTADMAQRFAQARLIVVGTGLQLVHPTTARLDAWAEVFRNWPARALLTPKPEAEWGRAERRLAELFTLLPATLQSLGFWVEELEQGEDARFERWRERVQDAPAAIYQPDDEVPMPLLLLQFPRNLVRWVAACAIYPSLHWDLTLWLGQKIYDFGFTTDDLPGAAPSIVNPQSQIVNLDDLLSIFRIRWFVQGHISQTARAALLNWLEQEDPALIPRLRGQLADLLAQSSPAEDSSAWADHRMADFVLNRWLSETDRRKKKALEKEIEKLLPRTEADFTVLKYLDRPPSPLHFQVPERWKKYVYRGGFRALGFTASLWSSVGAALLWLLGAWGIFAWQPAPLDDGCRGEKVVWQPSASSARATPSGSDTLRSEPITLCLDSHEDTLLWLERQVLDAIEVGDIPRLDTLSDAEPIDLTDRFDNIRQEIRLNLAAALYNKGVSCYAKSQKDSACIWFGRLKNSVVFESDPEYARARAWCENTLPDKPPAATDPACRQVANVGKALGFRTIALTQPQFDRITRNEDPQLERSTLIRDLPLGTRVELLDSSNALNWKIRYEGRTGFAAKYFRNKPTLLPCGQKPATPSTTAPTTPANNAAVAVVLPEMVAVPGGTFRMGSTDDDPDAENDEKLAHSVTLRNFDIGKYEVTIEEYFAFCDETKTHYPEWLEPGSNYHIETGSNDYYKTRGMSRENKKHPITGVSWLDAAAYCEWLFKKTGQKFRLPTEAEWEYAARGGQAGVKDNFKYAGSNTLGEVGWYSANSDSKTHPVGQKDNNPLGLYDMSGNVWEWCSDWKAAYPSTAQTDPTGPTNGSVRVLRGGSWGNILQDCRAALRYSYAPDGRIGVIGFRLARTP